MDFTINTHFNLNYNTTTKQTYFDKYDKSVKLPFVKVLINNMPHFKTFHADELKPDDSELAASDNIELSSAVTGGTPAGDTNTNTSAGGYTGQ
ncbi:MAG: hypothetical protein FWD38_05230 [Oscillospiraceae bacterium]|nr:hypothetical protein [Oscillospiraceae bacterium]